MKAEKAPLLARIAALGALAALVCSCSTRKMTMEQFAKLKPFQGRVVQIEKIPWPRKFQPSTMCGPDYRVTIVRPDQSRIIIPRMHTLVTSTLGSQSLTNKTVCTLPQELVQYEHKHGDPSY